MVMDKAFQRFGVINHCRHSRRLIGYLPLLLLLVSIDISATVRPPINVTIASGSVLQLGEQTTIYIVLEPLGDISEASFQLFIPDDWTFIGGQTEWAGRLNRGEPVQFEAYVVPTVVNPQPIRGLVTVPERGIVEGILDVSQLGASTGKTGIKRQLAPQDRSRERPLLRPKWEEALPAPTPEKPRMPLDPVKK